MTGQVRLGQDMRDQPDNPGCRSHRVNRHSRSCICCRESEHRVGTEMTGTGWVALGVYRDGDKTTAGADDRFARRRILTARERESLRSHRTGGEGRDQFRRRIGVLGQIAGGHRRIERLRARL